MDNTLNIVIPELKKKEYTINGDPNCVLRIDVSDMLVVDRVKSTYEDLSALERELVSLGESGKDDFDILEDYKKIDLKMRALMDKMFDANISEAFPNGSMYDPIGGKLRYEIIFEAITELYNDNYSKEIKKIQKRVKEHTGKYTKKGK